MVITKDTQKNAHKLTCINMQSFACIHGSWHVRLFVCGLSVPCSLVLDHLLHHIIQVHQFSPKQSNILQLGTKQQHQFNLSEKLIFGCSINQTRKQTTTQALGNLRQMCEPLEATKCSLEAHDIMQLKDLRMK